MNQLPNILSLFRIVISPVFFLLVISDKPYTVCIALPVFVIGGITDYLDGWLARKLKATSRFGKFFDPLADKFLTGAAFLAFVYLSILPLWMVLIVIFRDVMTTTMRFFPSKQSNEIVTSNAAKIKTMLQMLFIFVILVAMTFINCPIMDVNPDDMLSFVYSDFTYYSMLLIVVLTLWTLADYSKVYRS